MESQAAGSHHRTSVVDSSSALGAELRAPLRLRMVFMAGLPGTGKSLFVHQLAHLARAQGRRVHLLQWDVSRPVFEASPAGQRYPIVNGITHVVIRRAVGFWARQAVVDWDRTHAGAEHLLLGEVPLVGNRLTELVTPADDPAEGVLTDPSCVFVLPVPSDVVRRHIESERRRRFETPLHQRELEDAPPDVLQASWEELLASGVELGLVAAGEVEGRLYESGLYRRLYEVLLRYRNHRVIEVDTVLPTGAMSVYDYPDGCELIVPSTEDAARYIVMAERE